MKQDSTLKAAIDDLRGKMEFYRKEADKIETALKALQFVAPNGVPGHQPPVKYKEFARASIAEAAATIIKRAQRPLHVREIADALHTGGTSSRLRIRLDQSLRFSTQQPRKKGSAQ